MKLVDFEVHNFRNIRHLSLRPHPDFTFISGDNGQGKTNLMEAIYVLFNLRPIRSGKDFRPLVQKEQTFFSLGANVAMEHGTQHLFLSFTKGKKKLLVQKNSVSTKEFLSYGPLNFFSPDEATLLVESPEVRRRALDRSIFHLSPDYFDVLKRFKATLKRRNSVLKMERDKALLSSIDYIFAPLAHEVSQRRSRFIADLRPWYEATWRALKPSLPMLNLGFHSPSTDACTVEEYGALLQERMNQDFLHGTTSIGPQREDITFTIDGHSSKHFISHGERKIAALAFTLSIISMQLHALESIPILLIDDLAAELDEVTKEFVQQYLSKLRAQLIMTGISYPFNVRMEGAFFSIEAGNLNQA